MKFTWGWLKDHLDTKCSSEEICELLPMLGLEVEEFQNPLKKLLPFIAVEIKSFKKHPNADKLKICEVFTGKNLLQIICGASNVRVGLRTVLAPVNTWIPGKNLIIKKGNIRGEISEGMLCSPSELGISDEHEGIIELSNEVKIGESFKDIANKQKYSRLDPVIEISITPNRGDCLGVRGIARDIASAGYGSLKELDFSPEKGDFTSPIVWKIDDEVSDLVPIISGTYFKNLKNGSSPQWMIDRLNAIGQRPISAIVDITNYVMIDLGRPLHAFDAKKISGDTLFIRKGKKGEKILALNEKLYECDEDMIVIGDEKGPDDIAGIMGGERTGITEKTTEMFLEIAIFSPSSVASTGRKLNIISDARYRFERGLDQSSPKQTAGYIARLIKSVCGGNCSELVIIGNGFKKNKEILFSPNFTLKLTGLNCDEEKQYEILKNLGFVIDKITNDEWKVTVPSWRNDIDGKADLVEEIIRIYGYDKLEIKSLEKPNVIAKSSFNKFQKGSLFLKRFLSNEGFFEVINFSFINSKIAMNFGGRIQEMQLVNPISSELDCMRPSIIPNLLDVISKNIKRGEKDIRVFEVGPVFFNSDENGQKTSCAALRYGKKIPQNWQDNGTDTTVFDVKLDLLNCLNVIGLQTDRLNVSANVESWFHPGRAGKLELGKFDLGTFGEIHPQLLESFNINERVFCFEFFLENLPLIKDKVSQKKYINLSYYQAVERDFAFIVNKDLEVQNLLNAVRKAAKDYISDINVFDVYRGKNIESDKKSVAITLRLQPKEATFSEQQLNDISNQIILNVEKNCKGKLRS